MSILTFPKSKLLPFGIRSAAIPLFKKFVAAKAPKQ